MGTRSRYPYGIPLRTAFVLVILLVLGCFVWRVYGEQDYKNENNYQYVNDQVKYTDLLKNNYGERNLNEKDILPESQSLEADVATEEETTQDERVAMYEEEAKLQKQLLNYFDDEGPQADKKEEAAREQENEENREEDKTAQGGFDLDPIQKDFYEEYIEEAEESEASSDQESEDEGFTQEFYPGDVTMGDLMDLSIESKSESVEESSEDDEDGVYAEDQGDAEIARAFPNLYGKSESKSESDKAVVDDYFPGYDDTNATNADKRDPSTDNSTQQNEVANAGQEEKPDHEEQSESAQVKEGYTVDYDVKDEAYPDDIRETTEKHSDPYYFDPFRSALDFRERIDSLYNAQLEGMNYRNHIFDGAQFVSQLRQRLLDELTSFKDGFNSVADLPLVESPPSVEVQEGNDEIILRVSLPGTLRKSIRLELQNQQLILSGTRERRCPYSYGTLTFFHSFPVPRGVRSDDINAQFDDAKQTIQIHIQKPNEERPDPSRITIN